MNGYSSGMQRKQIQALSLIALLAIMLILVGTLFLPYASVLLWAAISYVLISPLYNLILRRMKPGSRLYEAKRHALAGIFALGTVIVMVGMFTFLVFQLVAQGKEFVEGTMSYIEGNPDFFRSNPLGLTLAKTIKEVTLNYIDLATLDFKAQVMTFLSSYSATIIATTRDLAKNLGSFVVSLAFIAFTLYFFYLDAAYLARLVVTAIPIEQKSTKRLLDKFREVTTNLFMGFFLVAFYQAAAAFVIFSVFRINGALLFAVLVLFASFIPMVGTALVWVPIGFSLIVTGNTVGAAVFLLLCAFFISFLDNFLRPLFLKDRIKIHPLLIFFSILGGISAFGLNGIVLGPLIIILFFTIVDIALEEESLTVEPPKESPQAP